MIFNIGSHKVQCQDIMLGLSSLMLNDIADFVYSDPPWGWDLTPPNPTYHALVHTCKQAKQGSAQARLLRGKVAPQGTTWT